jgi:hypothetical protein
VSRVVTAADNNRVPLTRASRSPLIRSARTNNPLMCPPGLDPRSSRGRRWRDLCRHYGQRLGAERLVDEATRARLLNLIWLTLELERLRDARVCDRPPVHTLLHMSQEQRVLLSELGLSEPARSNDDVAQPDPLDYAARTYGEDGAS